MILKNGILKGLVPLIGGMEVENLHKGRIMQSRFKTREVKIGKVGVGKDNPIRVQSMTTTKTDDVEATLQQIIELRDAGCEIVRVTVQGIKEALACEKIKNVLLQKGVDIPLVADIHFFPKAAMCVADFVDKVRINPGNYLDKRAVFKTLDYDDKTYAEELLRIEDNFIPLIEKCKKNKIALRLGVNHGSLSDRIMSRFGDTPKGMIESAFEYVRICRKLDYHELVFSMKASSPLVMKEAYRLLVAEMKKINWDYPIHLGVTEAGDKEDGVVKSAIGIGSLLLEGIGDTIRVSLTEKPTLEIEPAKKIIQVAKKYQTCVNEPLKNRKVKMNAFSKKAVVVFYTTPDDLLNNFEKFLSADFVYLNNIPKELFSAILALQKRGIKIISKDKIAGVISMLDLQAKAFPKEEFVISISTLTEKELLKLKNCSPEAIFFTPKNLAVVETKKLQNFLALQGIDIPVILHFSYPKDVCLNVEASIEMGAILSEKSGNGILIESTDPSRFDLSFAILQSCNLRVSKAEFIACPGCGRTLFDISTVLQKIKKRTSHLKGVKIAVMGCIVNGPGEMQDADFGYVGAGANKVDLYVDKKCVEKNIDEKFAEEKLIYLIKASGKWIEPS